MKKTLLLILATLSFNLYAQLTFVKKIDVIDLYPSRNSPSLYHPELSLMKNGRDFHGINNWLNEHVILSEFTSLGSICYLVDQNFSKVKNSDFLVPCEGVNFTISNHLFNNDESIELFFYVSFSDYTESLSPGTTYITSLNRDTILQKLENIHLSTVNVFCSGGKSYIFGTNTYDYALVVYELGGRISKECYEAINHKSVASNLSSTQTFEVSSNSTHNQLKIKSNINGDDMKVKIFDVNGMQLKEFEFKEGNNSYDISDINLQGTYVLNITSGNDFLHSEKIVIKK